MTAPSIYEYRSISEWRSAMAEWCAENEPKYNISCIDKESGRDVPVFKSSLDLFPKVQFCPQMPKRYSPPGHQPYGGCPDHLPGGSRSDYRMAGYRRY